MSGGPRVRDKSGHRDGGSMLIEEKKGRLKRELGSKGQKASAQKKESLITWEGGAGEAFQWSVSQGRSPSGEGSSVILEEKLRFEKFTEKGERGRGVKNEEKTCKLG